MILDRLRPDWQRDAACRGAGPDLFFDPAREHEAAAFCARCPVQAPCAAYAAREALEGVWAGSARQSARRNESCPECGEPMDRPVVGRFCSKTCATRASHRRARARQQSGAGNSTHGTRSRNV